MAGKHYYISRGIGFRVYVRAEGSFRIALHRFHNNGLHYYTTDKNEFCDYKYQGIVGYVSATPVGGSKRLYRLRNSANPKYELLTTNKNERPSGWHVIEKPCLYVL
jgi:hypothetical protein